VAPIPCFLFPESAAVALAHAAVRGEWLQAPAGHVPVFNDIDHATARTVMSHALGRGGGWLTPAESQTLLTAVRIPTAAAEVATSESGAVDAAARIGYPVALKVIGPEIIHKSEVGGVIVDVRTPEAAAAAWRDLKTRLGERMTGALVQAMVGAGVEMLLGITDDPTFGPVVACAMGGTLAELLEDSAFRLHPLTEQDAAAMIDRLKGARLLRGYRGAPRADERALRDCLLRLSALLEICPEIRELDINPLRVLPAGARALDVRVRIEPPRPRPATRRVSY
jgi:acyl-CoA synthetase (NDP forming)